MNTNQIKKQVSDRLSESIRLLEINADPKDSEFSAAKKAFVEEVDFVWEQEQKTILVSAGTHPFFWVETDINQTIAINPIVRLRVHTILHHLRGKLTNNNFRVCLLWVTSTDQVRLSVEIVDEYIAANSQEIKQGSAKLYDILINENLTDAQAQQFIARVIECKTKGMSAEDIVLEIAELSQNIFKHEYSWPD